MNTTDPNWQPFESRLRKWLAQMIRPLTNRRRLQEVYWRPSQLLPNTDEYQVAGCETIYSATIPLSIPATFALQEHWPLAPSFCHVCGAPSKGRTWLDGIYNAFIKRADHNLAVPCCEQHIESIPTFCISHSASNYGQFSAHIYSFSAEFVWWFSWVIPLTSLLAHGWTQNNGIGLLGVGASNAGFRSGSRYPWPSENGTCLDGAQPITFMVPTCVVEISTHR